MRTPPLPPRWSYKAPFIKDDEGTERHALDASGKLDRLKVAQILENHGHTEHAKAWRTDGETRDALAALLAACYSANPDDLRLACELARKTLAA